MAKEGKNHRRQQKKAWDKYITLFVISSTPFLVSDSDPGCAQVQTQKPLYLPLKTLNPCLYRSVLLPPGWFSNAFFDHIPRNLSASILPPSIHHLPLPIHLLLVFQGKHIRSDFCRHQATPGSTENSSYSEWAGACTRPKPCRLGYSWKLR